MIEKSPFFSVIIPSYARPSYLQNGLEAIARLSYPRERFEVIVVDDRSDSALQQRLSPFCDRFNLTILSQCHAGPAAARNRGRACARGDYVVFTDDDCVPPPGWLRELSERFRETPDCAIAGRTVNALTENIFSAVSQEITDYLHSYYNAEPRKARFGISSNLAMPAYVFDAAGGFDATFLMPAAEDRDLCDRLLERGFQLRYAPEISVSHFHELSPALFIKKHFTYGRGAYHYRKKRAQRAAGRPKREPVSFYTGLMLSPFSKSPRRGRLAPALLLALSQLATAAGYVAEKASRGTPGLKGQAL